MTTHILITGASRGIGAAIADALARPDCRTVALSSADGDLGDPAVPDRLWAESLDRRSEEHTSELQSLMRISYAVFCLKKKIVAIKTTNLHIHLSTIRFLHSSPPQSKTITT